MDYGPESVQVEQDLPESELGARKEKYYIEQVSVTSNQRTTIETETRSQSQNTHWHDERRKRLTASNFGSVMKRRLTSKVTPLVKQLLYKSFNGNKYTRYGIREEEPTRVEYVNEMARSGKTYTIRDSGLVIHRTHNHLACSPDGLVYQGNKCVGAIEIKNVLKDKPVTLNAEAKRNRSFCLELSKEGQLRLKRNHGYYFQVQGVANILEVPWVDFVVRTKDPYQIHIERIKRDRKFWQQQMFTKLDRFYKVAVLPELAAPREGKYPGIREPGSDWVTIYNIRDGDSLQDLYYLLNNLCTHTHCLDS